ncbi:MAG: PH domain-containing protein [Deltaproteobacteria bacterium]|jgi:hypothetical protein|nr:PH domain-containing protein [Deltaproteobacteria bacterium]MBW2533992.1 PH domain-containing protein [Deltaproteobacteria bacterium]
MPEEPNEKVAIKAKRVTMRRKPWLGAALGWTTALLFLLPLVVIMFGALFFQGTGKPWWAEHMMLSWLGGLGTGIAALWARAPWARVAEVSAEGDHITFTTKVEAQGARATRQVAVGDIAQGTVIPGFGARLEHTDGSTIEVEVESTRDAEKLVAACDLAVRERRFSTSFRPSWLRLALAAVGVLALAIIAPQLSPKVSMLTPADGATWMALAAAIFGSSYLSTRPPKVEVGADGVSVRTIFGSRFVRFEELAGVSLDGTKLKLELHDGDRIVVRAALGNQTQQQALRHRIEMGIAAHADEPQAPARLGLLDRRQRTMAQWREDLDQAVNDDVGYRRQPLSRDDLEAILAAPSTTTERRIGAAFALQALDGEEATPRIRIAAESCAEDQTRKALLRIAEQEHEHRAIEQALDEVQPRKAAESSVPGRI